MAYRIGLTGNIGCGKSTIGQVLEQLGAEYIDADRIVHELYQPGAEASQRIITRFGSSILGKGTAIDRRKLAQLVFNDPPALRDLEAILHPSVRAGIRGRIAASVAQVVVVDAIKLVETGLADEMDTVWVVTCPLQQQLRRLMETRGYSEEEARTRIAAQLPQQEKVRRAEVVIDNSGPVEDAREQAEQAWRTLMHRIGRQNENNSAGLDA